MENKNEGLDKLGDGSDGEAHPQSHSYGKKMGTTSFQRIGVVTGCGILIGLGTAISQINAYIEDRNKSSTYINSIIETVREHTYKIRTIEENDKDKEARIRDLEKGMKRR